MLNELINGFKPGATEWTENLLYGNWYREQGQWRADLSVFESRYTLYWGINVWLKSKGPNARDNNLAYHSIKCCVIPIAQSDIDCAIARALVHAKAYADAMLQARQ